MYVYIIKSITTANSFYIGISDDPVRRLAEHNAGRRLSTRTNRPWKPVATFWFENAVVAKRFEKYLKSGSGRSFCKKHFSIKHD